VVNVWIIVWNLICSFVLAAGLTAAVVANWISPTDVGPFIVLVALAVALLTRSQARLWARRLTVVALGAASGVAIFLGLVLLGAVEITDPALLPLGIAVTLVTVVLVFVLGHRRPAVAVVIAAVVVLAAVVTAKLVVDRQVQHTEQTAQQWRDNGWPVEAAEVFPEPPTRDRCQPWVDVCMELKEEPIEELYGKIAELSGEIAETLSKGTDLQALMLDSEIVSDPRWEQIGDLNARAVAAARQCPYLQWFAAEEFADSPWDIPLPDLLAMIRWARAMAVESVDLAARGETERSLELALDLVDASRRMQVRGQILITTLIGVAMERVGLVSIMAAQSISLEPLPDEVRARVDELADPDIQLLLTSLDVERFTALSFCQLSPPADYFEIGIPAPSFSLALLRRAAYGRICNQAMDDYTGLSTWFDSVPDFVHDDFAWHQARLELPRHMTSALTPNFVNAYGRFVVLETHWRQVLAVDAVLSHRADHGSLPEASELLETGWPDDPFTAQPMRYERLEDGGFLVYSLGPDEVDQHGDPLYVSGILDLRDAQDVGVHVPAG